MYPESSSDSENDRPEPMQSRPQVQAQARPPRRGGAGKALLLTVVVAVFVAAGVLAGFWWADQSAERYEDDLKQRISSLESDNSAFEARADLMQGYALAAVEQAESLVSDHAAIVMNAKRYDIFEPFMASQVNVVVANSEDSSETVAPERAVAFIEEELKDARTPWDFALSQQSLDEYMGSDRYSEYFAAGTLAGRSDNGYVFSLVLDEEGRISTVFMAAPGTLDE